MKKRIERLTVGQGNLWKQVYLLTERVDALEARQHPAPASTKTTLCACGDVWVDSTYTVERGGTKHSLNYCGPCCIHGIWEESEGENPCGQCASKPAPQCGSTFNEHRCTLDQGHEGWHQEWVERLVDTATWQDTPEVPQWRALVNDRAGTPALHSDPLARALVALASVQSNAESPDTVKMSLARIIAVCEAQVGDGWQADPDIPRVFCTRNNGGPCTDVECLIGALAIHDEGTRWMTLAGRAASWLRALCEEDT
jgi:hypothetical protein